jgi:hypothetical protein
LDGSGAAVEAYKGSLLSVQLACKASASPNVDARTLGEAISAFGFARNPDWLSPNPDLTSRRNRLCEILAGMSVESTTAVHRAAFADVIDTAPVDWRSKLNVNFHLTTRWIFVRSVARSLDLPMAKVTGKTSFTSLLGPRPEIGDLPPSTEWVKENGVLYEVPEPSMKERLAAADDDETVSAFIPITLGRDVMEASAIAQSWFQFPVSLDQVTLCFAFGNSKKAQGFSISSSTRVRLTSSDECEAPPKEALSTNQERALGALIFDLIESLDNESLQIDSQLQREAVKSVLCSAGVRSAVRAKQEPSALVRHCPRDVLGNANSLSFRAVEQANPSRDSERTGSVMELPPFPRR